MRNGKRVRACAWVLASWPCGALAAGEPPASSTLVATLALQAPAEQEFLLRATVPVPRGTWFEGDAGSPFTVCSGQGDAFRTQVEVVSRYPASAANGADVLEVMAWVQRPAGMQEGSPLLYYVKQEPQGDGAVTLHPDVAALLATDGALTLESRDVFGHMYTARILGGAQHPSRKDGPLLKEWSRHGVLRPEVVVGGTEGTLPHLMGVHSHLRAISDAGYLLLDLHVHNGMDGLDPHTETDDALLKLYFTHLALRLPPGWIVLHDFDDPAVGDPVPSGPDWSHPLLSPQKDHTLYVLPKQAHFVRRLAITRPEWESRARADLESRHLAFAKAGLNPDGQELWSWWNPATARYFPQRFPLPNLEHLGLGSLRAQLDDALALREAQVRSGAAGPYPMTSTRLGWAHPWGVGYGGMTGGDEIFPVDGLKVAASAARSGYRLAQLQMRAYVDRQPAALYSAHGAPTRVEDILVDGANGPYATATFFLLPQAGDPFGFGQSPTFQIHAAREQELDPRWEYELGTYSPIDFQHYIRYTRNLKILTWLGNDSLARAELEAAAELFRLSFHQYPYGPWSYVQESGLLAKMNWIAERPGEGLPTGRGDAWGIDAAAAAYSTGDEALRARLRPWMELVVDTFATGQSTCSGNLMASPILRLLGARYRVRRSNESGYLENALWGVRESFFLGYDPQRSDRLAQVVLGSIRAGVQDPIWSGAGHGPWLTLGVAPIDESYHEFCDKVPESANDGEVDDIHSWAGLAYGYVLSGGDPLFLQRAQEMAGSVPLSDKLHEDGQEWLEDRAPLLWLVQSLGG